jgi:cytochrome P450 family 307 subfamily A
MDECKHLVKYIQNLPNIIAGCTVDLKLPVTMACANIFNQYFCTSQRLSYDNSEFDVYCKSFDEVFWEVNNGRAVDFLPWLMVFFQFSTPIDTMKKASAKVRHFVESEIIAPKRNADKTTNTRTKDFLDSLMTYIDSKANATDTDVLSSQSALYALEDILGGHSAVANITLRILFDLALEGNLSSLMEVKQQLETCQCRMSSSPKDAQEAMISLEEKQELPWITASMHETIRHTCSPIVPHKATQDSTIGGAYTYQLIKILSNPHVYVYRA